MARQKREKDRRKREMARRKREMAWRKREMKYAKKITITNEERVKVPFRPSLGS